MQLKGFPKEGLEFYNSQMAQELGQSKWYESYKIEIVEILREYER